MPGPRMTERRPYLKDQLVQREYGEHTRRRVAESRRRLACRRADKAAGTPLQDLKMTKRRGWSEPLLSARGVRQEQDGIQSLCDQFEWVRWFEEIDSQSEYSQGRRSRG